MMRRTPSRPPKPKTQVQQEADFTSEGAPPPGKVATSAPVSAGKAGKADKAGKAGKPRSRAAADKTSARKGPPQGRYG